MPRARRADPAPRTTTIRVPAFKTTWIVPRGFGRIYRDVARAHAVLIAQGKPGGVIGEVRDLLELIGYTASTDTIADWSAQQRVEAVAYAATEHARAGDNPVQRHPRPAWLTAEPWKGTVSPFSRAKGTPDSGLYSGPYPTDLSTKKTCGKPARHGLPCSLDPGHVARKERHSNGAFSWALRGKETA